MHCYARWGRRRARGLRVRLAGRWVGLGLGDRGGGFALLSLAPEGRRGTRCARCLCPGCLCLCVRRAGAPGPAACGPALFSRLVPLCVFCASLCCVAAVALLAGVSSVLLIVCFLPCAVWALRAPCFPCGVVLVSHYGQFRGAYFLCNSLAVTSVVGKLSLDRAVIRV